MAENKDQSFVEYVAKELVEKPEKVKVDRSVDEMGVLIELTVDKDDMGVIIGKEGRTAKAIRTLLRVLGAKNDARVNLKIIEPEGSEHVEKKPVSTDESGGPASTDEPEKKESTEEETKEAKSAPEEEKTEESEEESDDERPMADLEL